MPDKDKKGGAMPGGCLGLAMYLVMNGWILIAKVLGWLGVK